MPNNEVKLRFRWKNGFFITEAVVNFFFFFRKKYIIKKFIYVNLINIIQTNH